MAGSLRLLVVDDDLDYAEMVVGFLRLTDTSRTAEVQKAGTYDAALAMLRTQPFDVAFIDYWLGARDGLSLLREMRQQGIKTPVIVLTGRGAEEVAVDSMKAGAADYLSKTQLSTEALDRSVRHALALRAGELQRHQAETALRASEERFRALVENSSDTLLLLDAEGRVRYTSPSSERSLGWKPAAMIGRSIFDFLHQDDRDTGAARLADTLNAPGQPVRAEVRFQTSDANFRILEAIAVNRIDDPSVGAIVVNARDITERRRLEGQLRQAQKMEAVGQLAGGVAHDFNNLLTAILGYCNLMLDDVKPDDPLRHDLEEVRSAGERAAAMTRQLLAFSRRQILQPQVVSVNLLIRQLEKLLRGLISPQVELVTTLAQDLAPVKIDPASIEQMLVNLAVNARDAMAAGGRLTIETSNVNLDDAAAAARGPMPAGRFVMLCVSDTGEGMDAATRARVFEPYFTAREPGIEGGLGLATVYSIVKQNGGYVWADSEPGHGTTFRIYLPPAEAVMIQRSADRHEDLEKKQGWETVLLVENDDAVRALAREVLRRHGYTVLEARHGVDAVRLAERHRDNIHMMITAIVMPHMNGRELAERLWTVRPKLKVLFMSGYTDHVLVHDDLPNDSSFLEKPFTPETLVRKVRMMLNRTAELGDVAPKFQN